jgi:DNA-binding transcriptional LysR family regulator
MNQLEQMRVFVELINSGSATRAADKLGLANSAVSRRLKELEARLGIQLVHRTTRTMHLTDAGRQFYARCKRILEDIQEAEVEVSENNSELSGQLSIAAPWSFGVSHLSAAVSEFMHRHPKVQVDLDLNDRRVDLISEGFDIAIRIGTLEDSSLIARRIAPVNHVVCASPDYLQRNGTPETPEQLSEHQGLCYSNLKAPEQWFYFDQKGNRHTVKVSARLRSSNGDTLRNAAIAGLGVLCEPSFIVYRAIRKGLLIPILTNYQWYEMGIYALYPQTRHLSAKTRAFIDFLVDRFGEQPEWETWRSVHKNRAIASTVSFE